MTTDNMPRRGEGTQVVLEKLENCIRDGDYYAAQQMYKTLYFRYLSQKRCDDLKKLLYSGAMLMLQHGEINAGTELATLLIDVFTKSKTSVTEESLNLLIDIWKAYKNSDNPAARKTFINAAVKWSALPENNNQGSPLLHTEFAHYYHLIGEFETAQKHYLRSADPNGFVNMLHEWSLKGYPSECDLFIGRAVLMYLCLSDLKNANTIYQLWRERFPTLDTPLMNFLNFLLQTLERDALPLFVLLREKYKQTLERDQYFNQYLDRIAQVFFGVKSETSGGGLSTLMNAFMKSLLDTNNENQ
jgi:hypothetical protein